MQLTKNEIECLRDIKDNHDIINGQPLDNLIEAGLVYVDLQGNLSLHRLAEQYL